MYGIICEKESSRESYLMTTELVPALIGLLGSVLSDTYGRVKTFKILTFIIMLFSVISAFIPNVHVQVIGLSIFIGEEAI